MSRQWSDKELGYIKSNALTMTGEEMSLELSKEYPRTASAVRTKLSNLGVAMGKSGPRGKADHEIAEMVRVLKDNGYGERIIKRFADVAARMSFEAIRDIAQYRSWR